MLRVLECFGLHGFELVVCEANEGMIAELELEKEESMENLNHSNKLKSRRR